MVQSLEKSGSNFYHLTRTFFVVIVASLMKMFPKSTITNKPFHGILLPITYLNSEGSDEPAYHCSLTRAFTVRIDENFNRNLGF